MQKAPKGCSVLPEPSRGFAVDALCFGLVLLEQAQDDCADDAASRQSDDVHHSVVNDREDEDAAVGCAECAAEGHGQGTGQSRTNDAAGQDTQGVSRCIGNRTLGDEAQTHDIVDDTVAAFVGRPLLRAEGG